MITKEDAHFYLSAILKESGHENYDEIIDGKFVFMHFDVDKQKFDRLTFKDIVMAYYGLIDRPITMGFIKCQECGNNTLPGYQCKNPKTGKCELINFKVIK